MTGSATRSELVELVGCRPHMTTLFDVACAAFVYVRPGVVGAGHSEYAVVHQFIPSSFGTCRRCTWTSHCLQAVIPKRNEKDHVLRVRVYGFLVSVFLCPAALVLIGFFQGIPSSSIPGFSGP